MQIDYGLLWYLSYFIKISPSRGRQLALHKLQTLGNLILAVSVERGLIWLHVLTGYHLQVILLCKSYNLLIVHVLNINDLPNLTHFLLLDLTQDLIKHLLKIRLYLFIWMFLFKRDILIFTNQWMRSN